MLFSPIHGENRQKSPLPRRAVDTMWISINQLPVLLLNLTPFLVADTSQRSGAQLGSQL